MCVFHHIIWPALSHSAGLQFTSSDISLMQVLVSQCHPELRLFWKLVAISVASPSPTTIPPPHPPGNSTFGLPAENWYWSVFTLFQVQQLSGMKLEKRLPRYFEKQMGLKPYNFLGNIPEAAVLRAVMFIQASVPLWDNAITRRVCTSTVCFGWIIVHGAIGIWQQWYSGWPAYFSWEFMPYQFWSDWKSYKKLWKSTSWHVGHGPWEAGVPRAHQCFGCSSLPEWAFDILDNTA